MPNRYISYFLSFFGLLIMGFFISSLNINEVYKYITEANPSLMTVAILFLVSNVIVKGYRWKLIIHNLTGFNISMDLASLSIIAGVAAGSIIPGRGDIAKPLMLKNIYNIPLTKSMSGMVIERILDVSILFLLLFASIPFVVTNSSLITSLIGGMAIFLFFVIIPVFFSERVILLFDNILRLIGIHEERRYQLLKHLTSFLQGFSILKRKDGIFLFTLSFLAMLLEISRLSFIFRAMNIDISIILATFSFVSSILIGLLALIPGGIGATELSQALIINEYLSISVDMIKSAVLLDRILSYYSLVLLGSIILLIYKKLYPVEEDEIT
ncbi:flippase-like domain-containing protein [Methanococcoides sp. SA1]|nr:flippase-like domain-containing protein [Methanococcoides sp. SA1]